MYKNFQSKFMLLVEEDTQRFKNQGFETGDYCVIVKNALSHPEIVNRADGFKEKVKQMIKSDKPLKISAIKSTRPESSNDLIGGAGGGAFTGVWLDIITCLTPATWVDPITLPGDIVEVVVPEDGNWSPAMPDSWKYANKVQIKPKAVKKAKGETEEQTQASKQKLATKDTKGLVGKGAKDGRDQAKKPVEYKRHKESVELYLEGFNDDLDDLDINKDDNINIPDDGGGPPDGPSDPDVGVQELSDDEELQPLDAYDFKKYGIYAKEYDELSENKSKEEMTKCERDFVETFESVLKGDANVEEMKLAHNHWKKDCVDSENNKFRDEYYLKALENK